MLLLPSLNESGFVVVATMSWNVNDLFGTEDDPGDIMPDQIGMSAVRADRCDP
jgi:hypothetical protein